MGGTLNERYCGKNHTEFHEKKKKPTIDTYKYGGHSWEHGDKRSFVSEKNFTWLEGLGGTQKIPRAKAAV